MDGRRFFITNNKITTTSEKTSWKSLSLSKRNSFYEKLIKTMFDDEKIKLLTGNKCSYCDSTDNLAFDYIFPQKLDGEGVGGLFSLCMQVLQ